MVAINGTKFIHREADMINQKLVNAVLDQIGDMEPTETLNLMGDIDKHGEIEGVN